MWLLNAHTLTLEYVTSSKHARYAILSHTWEEEEVTFQEIRESCNPNKKGFLKIANTCRQALQDGFDHVWIDTCCINKESSAELSESINSMWRWYCDAKACYAYLSDVDEQGVNLSDDNHPDFARGDISIKHQAHVALAQSRWFTRGWTLQELIAPSELMFFNRVWCPIGTKDRLVLTLWQITKIDPPVLEDREELSHFVVARKMSWAAWRSTTREEDRAYSLFGIFGVNMPLLYGEGTKAFIRFQEEIMKLSTDHSIFAWSLFGSRSCIPWETDLLFAPSPACFSKCRRMVRWRSEMFDKEFQLTNRGIVFESLLISEGKEESFAVLNCRNEDDFGGILALRIWNENNNVQLEKTKVNKTHFGKKNFWINGRSQSRLALLDSSQTADAQSQRINLLRQRPVLSYDDSRELPKFWVVSSTPDREEFHVLNSIPQGLWNHERAVMCPLTSEITPITHRSTALVEGVHSRARISLAFNAESLARYGDSLVVSSRSHEAVWHVLPSAMRWEAYVDPEGPLAPGVSVKPLPPVKMFGDWVCKIEISVATELPMSKTNPDR